MIAQPSGGPAAPTTPAPVATVVVPDWGNQVSAFQTRQPAFWLYVVVLAICGILLATTEFDYLRYSPIAFVVGAVLLAIFAVPVFLLIGVLDLFEREPLSLMVAAFLWGAVAVFPFALATNNALIELWLKLFGDGLGIGWLTAIIPPPVEEILKFLGIVTVFLIARSEFDDVLDGFVYGALVGLGFQITEDMFYFFTHFIGPAQGANEIGALIEGYWIRVISSGLYSHPLYAGISGMGLAYWATRLDQPLQRRRLFLFGGLGVAILLHVFWNAPLLTNLLGDNPGPVNWLIFSSVKGIPLLIFIGIMVRLATRREQTYFQAIMGPAMASDVITPDEMRGLSDLRARFAVRRAMRARKGPVASKLLARLQREQLRYAMIATQTIDNRDTLLAAQAELIRTLRAQLSVMPDAPRVAVAMPTPAGVQPVTVAAPTAGWGPGSPTPWAGGQPGAGAAPTWQPTMAQPTLPQGTVAQPIIGQPAMAQPAMAQPTAAQPAMAQPAMAQPTAAQPTTAQPAMAQPTAAQPTTAQPAMAQPAVAQPMTSQPTAAQPAVAQPAIAQPVAQPTMAQPAAAQPATAQSATTQPTATQPTPAQPAFAQPSAGQPTGAQPGQPAWSPPAGQQSFQPAWSPQPAGQQPGQPAWSQPASQPQGQPAWSQQPTGQQPSQPAWSQPTGQQPAAGWRQPAGQQPGPAWQPGAGQQPGTGQQPAGQQPAGQQQGQPAWSQPAGQQPGSPGAWQQPSGQQQWRPAAPAVPAGPAGWAPTHRAAAPGQQSWDQPDPSRPMTPLAGGLDLQVVQRVGDWARVVAVNGWSGWVDARLLTPRQ